MTCPDVTNNSNLLEGKPRGSVTLKTLIDAINVIIQDNLIDASCDIETQSSILTATGIWLDYIGYRLKYPRPEIAQEDLSDWFGFDGQGVGFDQEIFTPTGPLQDPMEDEPYRACLIVRGGQLLTDGSISSLDATIDAAFNTGHYIDNGDMSLDVIIDTTQQDKVITALVRSGLITKPAGVRINQILVADLDGTFGFDGNGVGFDQGHFVRTIEELPI